MGCRRVSAPATLTRIARRPDGTLAIGRDEPGRGAWLCRGSHECFEAALRRRMLSRALRVEIPPADAEALRARLFGERGSM